jgi:phage baseplate assembly protein W
MTSTSPAPTLLEELDARQNEVLRQLDDLNQRIEDLLRQHGARVMPPPASTFPILSTEPTMDTVRVVEQVA